MAPGPASADLKSRPVVVDDLGDFVGFRVIGEEADRTIAVRKEVDVVADPHGVEVVRIVARNLLHVGIGQARDPDGHGLAAAIALPGGLPLELRRVGDLVNRPARSEPREAMGSGSSEGKPPSTGTVKSLGGSVLLVRLETNRMLLPSGLQPSA